MRRKGLENLTFTVNIVGKSVGGESLAPRADLSGWWNGTETIDMGDKPLRTTRDKELWRDITAYIVNGCNS